MTSKPTRAQFIDKLRTLEMSVNARTNPFLYGEPHESRGVVHWEVSGEIELSDGEADTWGAPALSLDGLQVGPDQVRLWVFHMKGMTVHLEDVENAWDVLDARDVDSSHFTPLIDADTGELSDHLSQYEEDAPMASTLVVIDRVHLAEGWRGQGGLGRLMIEQAVRLVADPVGSSLVALEAHPYLEETDGGTASLEAVAATERIWASMGFAKVGRSKLYVRSTTRVSPFDDVWKSLSAG